MRTWPLYDADATMVVPKPHYLLETAFISYFLRKVSWFIEIANIGRIAEIYHNDSIGTLI